MHRLLIQNNNHFIQKIKSIYYNNGVMKKNNFKLKDEIIILPNADKDGGWIEKWTKETHGCR